MEGAGSGSGEDMEQFFSHLSRTGNTTKHMGKAGKMRLCVGVKCVFVFVLFCF